MVTVTKAGNVNNTFYFTDYNTDNSLLQEGVFQQIWLIYEYLLTLYSALSNNLNN